MDTDFKIELSADSSQLETNIQSSLDKRTFKIKVVADNVDGQANISGASSVSGSKGLSKTAKSITSAAMRTENLKAQLDRLLLSGKITTEQFDTFNKTLDAMSQKLSQDKKIDDFTQSTNSLNNAIKRTIVENNNQAKAEKEATRALEQKAKAQEKENKALEKAKLKKYNEDLKAQAKAEKEAAKAKNELLRSADKASNKIVRFGETNQLSQKQVADYTAQIAELKTQFSTGSINAQQFAIGIDQISMSAEKSKGGIGTFIRNVGSMIKGFMGFQLAATIVMQVINIVRKMVDEVKAIDAAIVELNKVSDASAEELAKVKKQAFELADGLGTTGVEVLNATTEFKRMGYTMEESLNLAEVAVMMTNVAEGIDDAGEAANILTSILKGTGLSAKYAMSLLDRLNEVSNNNAVSFDALAHMLQESAATMKILGNNIDETIGLLTGAFTVLQDESVANSIRTLSLRISGLNEDLESEVGLSNQVTEALRKYADIDVFDKQTKQIRSTFSILEELAGKWNDIDKNQQAVLLNVIAGKRQSAALSAILENWDVVSKSAKDAADSMGSAQREQEAYLDSIEGRMNRLKNTFQQLADEIIGSDLVKIILESAQYLVKALGTALKLVKNLINVFAKLQGYEDTLDFIETSLAYINTLLSGINWVIEKISNSIDKISKKLESNKFGKSLKGYINISRWLTNPFGQVTKLIGKSAKEADKDAKGLVNDYADLSETFASLNKEVSEFNLQTQFLKENQMRLANSLEEYLDTVEEEHNALEAEKDLQEKILSVEKARMALAEAKQKKTRVFRAGVGFVYEADATAVQNAQEELTEAINELAEYKFDYALDRARDFVSELQELLQGDDITQGWEELFDRFGDLLDTEFGDFLKKSKNFVDQFNLTMGLGSEGLSALSAQSVLGQQIEEKLEQLKTAVDDEEVKTLSGEIHSLIDTYKAIGGKALGTRSFSGGMTWVGENGPELMNLPRGTEILSNPQSMKLHDIVNNPSRYVSSATNKNGSNSVIINGPINLPNVTDADGFIDAMVAIGNNSIPQFG